MLADFLHFRQTEILQFIELGLIDAQDVVPAIHGRQIVVDVTALAKVGVKGAVVIQIHIELVEDAQKTPEMWSPKLTAIKSLVAVYHVALNADSSVMSAVLSFIIDGANPGPVGKAQ